MAKDARGTTTWSTVEDYFARALSPAFGSGVQSELLIYPQEGHGVRAFPALIDECTRIIDFLSAHLRA